MKNAALFKGMPKGAKKWLAFSCSHAPLQDWDAINYIADVVKALKPDYVIHLGDAHEADSASRWPSEYSWDLEFEFAECNEVLRKLRMAHPKRDDCQCILLPGNHDDNLMALNRIDKKLRGLCDWTRPQYTSKRALINDEVINHWRIPTRYNYSRKDGVFSIGATSFFHGFECNNGSDRTQAITLGRPYGLTVSGHTHRDTEGEPKPVMLTQRVPLPYWYLNTGCTRQMECDYMQRKYQGTWGQGVAYGWSLPIRSPRYTRTWDAYCDRIKGYE